MRITFAITRENYWNFNKYAIFKYPKFRDTFFLNLLSIPLLVLITGILLKFSFGITIAAIILATITGYYFILGATKRRILRLVKNKKVMFSEHTIEIDEAGIKEITEEGETLRSWNDIKSIEENNENVFIFVDNLSGHFIPKKAFSSVEESKKFYNKAMEYWKNVNCKG